MDCCVGNVVQTNKYDALKDKIGLLVVIHFIWFYKCYGIITCVTDSTQKHKSIDESVIVWINFMKIFIQCGMATALLQKSICITERLLRLTRTLLNYNSFATTNRQGSSMTHRFQFVNLRFTLQLAKVCHKSLWRCKLLWFKKTQQTVQFFNIVL